MRAELAVAIERVPHAGAVGPEPSEANRADILGNDLAECADDAIEADFAMGNVRVIRDRSVGSFIAWSSQPSLGGPTWFVRNPRARGLGGVAPTPVARLSGHVPHSTSSTARTS